MPIYEIPPETDWEAFFDQMRDAEKVALVQATEEQKSVDWGDYWFRLYEAYGTQVAIWSYTYTEDEIETIERGLGADDDEIREEMFVLRDAHKRGYRYGNHFSLIEPKGELGSTHLTNIDRKITKEEFEAAKERGWTLEV